MRERSTTERKHARASSGRGRACRTRSRWCRVRVETDAGAYVGSLELGAAGLRELVDGERAYLGLWDAELEGAPGVHDFLALHKGAICSVVVVGEGRQAAPQLQEA